MDFHKLENDTIKLKVSKIDIISFATIGWRIPNKRKEKGIYTNTFGLEDSLLAWVDEDKMDKIFGNLMSNALSLPCRRMHWCIWISWTEK